ncbi:hypothetical protein LZ318_11765 [Saccharopolyspora indica]|uniref:hypothetical protein n=1 Tax=Saccharopolyspora indica TaxID=1229659 RepID=UPI0022EB4F99|nr:hypothetical protein [Saccharopolyspora indica]MDA3643812.1 hypothetical protein [Saccharopolyspora indica]
MYEAHKVIVITPESANEFVSESEMPISIDDHRSLYVAEVQDGRLVRYKVYAADKWDTVEVQLVEVEEEGVDDFGL